jgi:hypothetical protein
MHHLQATTQPGQVRSGSAHLVGASHAVEVIADAGQAGTLRRAQHQYHLFLLSAHRAFHRLAGLLRIADAHFHPPTCPP